MKTKYIVLLTLILAFIIASGVFGELRMHAVSFACAVSAAICMLTALILSETSP